MEVAIADELSPLLQEMLALANEKNPPLQQKDAVKADSELRKLLHKLECTEQGLSSTEAAKRLLSTGPNKFEHNKERRLFKLCKILSNPFSIILEMTIIIYIMLGILHGSKTLYLELTGVILLLAANTAYCALLINLSDDIAFKQLCTQNPKSTVLRDGQWCKVDAECLVPGDIISIKSGDVVCADVFLLSGKQYLVVEKYWHDGRYMHTERHPGGRLRSGTNCLRGELPAIVVATGRHRSRELVCCSDLCRRDQFSRTLMSINRVCTFIIAIGVILDTIIVYVIHQKRFSEGINSVLALGIGLQFATPTFLSAFLDAGFLKMSQLGVLIKHKPAIDQLARIDMLLSRKTGVLTLNKPYIVSGRIKVFGTSVDRETAMLLSARASSKRNPDSIDSAIWRTMDPMKASHGITEVYFHHFSLLIRRTATTFVDGSGNWYRACKGNPDEILDLCECSGDFRAEVYKTLDDITEDGFRILAVARQAVPERTKQSKGDPWEFVGLLPLYDPFRAGYEKLVPMLLKLGVKLKIVSADHLSVVKNVGRRLGIGNNIHPSDLVTGRKKYASGFTSHQRYNLIRDADGIAGLFAGGFENVVLHSKGKHVCGMLGYGPSDFNAMALADVRFTLQDACDVAKSISDVILVGKDVSMICDAIMTGRAIYWTRRGYAVLIISTTVYITFSFVLVSGIWNFIIPPSIVLVTAVLDNALAIFIPYNYNKFWPSPGYWRLKEIIRIGATFGIWLAFSTTFFFWVARCTNFFTDHFGVQSLRNYDSEMTSALFLQVNLMIHGLLLATQCHGSCFVENPGKYLLGAFTLIQVLVTWMASLADCQLFEMKGIGWKWAGVIWCYDAVFFLFLDCIKLALLYFKEPDQLPHKET